MASSFLKPSNKSEDNSELERKCAQLSEENEVLKYKVETLMDMVPQLDIFLNYPARGEPT